MASAEIIPANKHVPKAKGLHWIDFTGCGTPTLVCCYLELGQIKIQALGDNGQPKFTIRQCFDSLIAKYRQMFPVERVDEPVLVAQPEKNEPGNYRIVKLARGLLVAFSDFFVAIFDRRYGQWFLKWVAHDPSAYIEVRVDVDKELRGVLLWDGLGLEISDVVEKAKLRQTIGMNQPLLPYRVVVNVNELNSFWIAWQSDLVYATTRHHTFRFVELEAGPGEWSWTMFSCEAEIFVSDCHLNDLEFEIQETPWKMLIKREVDSDGELV